MQTVGTVKSGCVGLILSISLLQVACSQCPEGYPCPSDGQPCYRAEITGVAGQCGSIGVFPNQTCCITLYYTRNCRRNPDCTGEICGQSLQPILVSANPGSCSSLPLGGLQCGQWTYFPDDNKICNVYGDCVVVYLPPMPCPDITLPPRRTNPRIASSNMYIQR